MSCIVGAVMCGAMYIAGPLHYAPEAQSSSWVHAAVFTAPILHQPPQYYAPAFVLPGISFHAPRRS